MQIPYIAVMADDQNRFLDILFAKRDNARADYLSHCDPGNLTAAGKRAFQYRNMALLLMLKAAQLELDAELEFHALMANEAA